MFDNRYHTRVVWSIPKTCIDHRLPKATDISRTGGKWPSRFNEVYLAVVVCPSNSSRFPVPSSIALPISFDTSGMLSACTVESSQHKRSSLALPNFNVPGEKLAFEATSIKTDASVSLFYACTRTPRYREYRRNRKFGKKKNGGYGRSCAKGGRTEGVARLHPRRSQKTRRNWWLEINVSIRFLPSPLGSTLFKIRFHCARDSIWGKCNVTR